jgi:hypothetical protein
VQATLTGPKKVIAGKRDFSEIVNFTRNIDDNDNKDDYPPTKKSRLDSNLHSRLFHFLSSFPLPTAFTLPASLPFKFPLVIDGSRNKKRLKKIISLEGWPFEQILTLLNHSIRLMPD